MLVHLSGRAHHGTDAGPLSDPEFNGDALTLWERLAKFSELASAATVVGEDRCGQGLDVRHSAHAPAISKWVTKRHSIIYLKKKDSTAGASGKST